MRGTHIFKAIESRRLDPSDRLQTLSHVTIRAVAPSDVRE